MKHAYLLDRLGIGTSSKSVLIVVADVLPVELFALLRSLDLLSGVEGRVIVLKDRIEKLLEFADSLSGLSIVLKK